MRTPLNHNQITQPAGTPCNRTPAAMGRESILPMVSKISNGGGNRLHIGRTAKRLLLVALLVLTVGAVSPFAWNYLQSFQSTDDAKSTAISIR